MAGQLTVTGHATEPVSGSPLTIGPFTLVAANVIAEVLDVSLLSGDNTFSVPSGTTFVYFVPPTTNGATLKFRTSANSGDAGLPMSSVDSFGPYSIRGLTVTTVIINASGSVPGCELYFI